MNSSDFWYMVGDFIAASFKFLPLVGNFFNWTFIGAVSGGLLLWMYIQQKYNSEEMKESGKLK